MPIREIFNQKKNHDDLVEKITKLEKEVKRINTLEVNMKRLLKLEGRLQSISNHTMTKKSEQRSETRIPKQQPERQESLNTEMLEATIMERVLKVVHSEMNSQSLEFKKFTEQLSVLKSEIIEIKEQMMLHESTHKKLLEEVEQVKIELNSRKNEQKSQPVVYQDIKIDKMLIDQYEMNNNIAQLGVKDLSGSLNIGATYGTGIIPEDLAEDFKEKMNQLKKEKQDYQENNESQSSDSESPKETAEEEIDIDIE